MPIKHIFVNQQSDGPPDPNITRPSDWNDVHSITFTQTELTSLLFGALGSGSASQFLETTGPSGIVQWATPSGGSGISVSGTPLINQLTGWNNSSTIAAISVGNNLSLVAGTLAAIDAPSAVSIAGSPTSLFITGWQNQTTITSIAVGLNLTLTSGTLQASSGSGGGVSVVPTPTGGQIAAWGNAASLLGVTIGTNVSLIGGNTLSVPAQASAVSIAGSPTSIFITGWQNATTITSIAVGANLSLASGTLSATSNSGISVTGSPAAGLIAAWASSNSLLGVTIGANISLVGGNTISAPSAGTGVSVVPTPTAGQLTAWGNAASILGVTIGSNVSLIGGNTISATGGGGGVSVAGTPLANQITGWNNASTITALSIGANISLTSNTLSAVSGAPASMFITGLLITRHTTTSAIDVSSGTFYDPSSGVLQNSSGFTSVSGGTLASLQANQVYLYSSGGNASIEIFNNAHPPSVTYYGTARQGGAHNGRWIGSFFTDNGNSIQPQNSTETGQNEAQTIYSNWGDNLGASQLRILSGGTSNSFSSVAAASVVPKYVTTLVYGQVQAQAATTGGVHLKLSTNGTNQDSGGIDLLPSPVGGQAAGDIQWFPFNVTLPGIYYLIDVVGIPGYIDVAGYRFTR